MPGDDDGIRRMRVVRVPGPPSPKSPGAEAAARYRARKRGENVPKRKPGPKPATAFVLRQQIADLERRLSHSELIRRQLTEQVRRQAPTVAAEQQDLTEWK